MTTMHGGGPQGCWPWAVSPHKVPDEGLPEINTIG